MSDEERREKQRLRIAEWRRKNPERAKAIAATYRDGHREDIRARDRAKRPRKVAKIRISYPGQEVQLVPVQPHIIDHFCTKGWPLPFIEIVR